MSKSTVQAKQNYPTEPKIKYVKKARMWVKTWFEESRGNYTQKQQWAQTKEELEK